MFLVPVSSFVHFFKAEYLSRIVLKTLDILKDKRLRLYKLLWNILDFKCKWHTFIKNTLLEKRITYRYKKALRNARA